MSMDLDRYEYIKKQKEYCQANNVPFFMPNNGYCWDCGCDIVIYLAEDMDKKLITGCPSCRRSYCD